MIPKEILNIPKAGKIKSPDGSYLPIKDSINPDELRDIWETVTFLRPVNTLEIGLATGVSAVAICGSLEEIGGLRFHHAIDPFQSEWDNIGEHAPQAYGLGSRFKFYRYFPEEVVPALPTIQFAFIDGSHLFDYTILDFLLCDKKMDSGGVIAFHDCWMPSIRKAVRYILSNRDYRIWKPPHLRQWSPKYTLFMKARSFLGSLLRSIPKSEKIFAAELLRPWHEISRRNLIFLTKTAEDKRKWSTHNSF